MRWGFWKADGFLGLAVVMLLAAFNPVALASVPRMLSDEIAIIGIDKHCSDTGVPEGLLRFLEI